MDRPTQTTIDFAAAELRAKRGWQLAAIRGWVPPEIDPAAEPTPPKDATLVDAAAIKHVLRAIDDHAGGRACWCSQQTLAAETGYGVRTVRRAIAALCWLNAICCQRAKSPHGLVVNHYTIVWSTLSIHQGTESAMPSLSLPERQATLPECEAIVTDREATMASPRGHGGLQSAPEAHKKRRRPPTPQPEPAAAEVLIVEDPLRRLLAESGIERIETAVAHCRRRQLGIDQVTWAIQTARANAGRFQRTWQAGLVDWLRTGDWPVAVRTLEEIESARLARVLARRKRRRPGAPTDDSTECVAESWQAPDAAVATARRRFTHLFAAIDGGTEATP